MLPTSTPSAHLVQNRLDYYKQALEAQVLPTLLNRSPVFWPGFAKLRPTTSALMAPKYPETHKALELAHVLHGSGRVFYNDKWCTAHIGDTFILPSSTQHDFISNVSPDFDALWIFCSQSEDNIHFQQYKDVLMQRNPNLQLIRSQAAQRSLDNLIYRISHTSRQLDLSLWATVVQFITDIIDIMDMQQPTKICSYSSGLPQAHRQVIENVCYLLRRDLREEIELDSLANHVGFTKSYLCTMFKKATGETIFDCLRRIRLQRAKELLLQNNLSIQEVASAVGYRNTSSFTRAFHAFFKCAPNEMRSDAKA